jgi:hypothetical protein
VSEQKTGTGRNSFLSNLGAGNFGPVDRTLRVLGNIGRKVVRREACCGNYGDPGC